MCSSSVCRLLHKSVPHVSAMTCIVSYTFYLFHFDIELCLFIWLKMHFEYPVNRTHVQCAINWIECEADRKPTTKKLCSPVDDDAPPPTTMRTWRQLLSVSNLFAFMHEIKLTRISKHNINRNYKQYTKSESRWMNVVHTIRGKWACASAILIYTNVLVVSGF